MYRLHRKHSLRASEPPNSLRACFLGRRSHIETFQDGEIGRGVRLELNRKDQWVSQVSQHPTALIIIIYNSWSFLFSLFTSISYLYVCVCLFLMVWIEPGSSEESFASITIATENHRHVTCFDVGYSLDFYPKRFCCQHCKTVVPGCAIQRLHNNIL